MIYGQFQSTSRDHRAKSATPLGTKLAELYFSAKYLLFGRGEKSAQRQKEGRSDCAPIVGLREELSREGGAQEPTSKEGGRQTGRQASRQAATHPRTHTNTLIS